MWVPRRLLGVNVHVCELCVLGISTKRRVSACGPRRSECAIASAMARYVLHRQPRPPPVKVPPHLPPSLLHNGAYFCSDSMLEPLKRYGINPKTRSQDGYAVKLHPLSSCDSQVFLDCAAFSRRRRTIGGVLETATFAGGLKVDDKECLQDVL